MHLNISKKWILYFISIILIILGTLEYLSQRTANKFRTTADYKTHISESTQSDKIDTIFLSDSVSNIPMSKYILNENILDLTTNQAISLAGNYFLLKRYLDMHKAPKNLYLFFIPNLMTNQLKGKLTYLYFTTVFHNKYEKKVISSLDRNDIYEKLSYFNQTKYNLKKMVKEYKPRKRVSFDKKYNLKKIQKNIDKKRYRDWIRLNTYADLKPFSDHFLEKIIEISHKHNINFHLVIEPMAEEFHELFLESKLYRKLQEKAKQKKFTLLDVNNYFTFYVNNFRDVSHLLNNYEKKYLDIIDKNITNIFTNKNYKANQKGANE